MKKLLVITSLLIMTVSGSLMAKTGFELNVLLPFGMSVGTYTGDNSKFTKTDLGFEFGIHVIPGYYFGISNIDLGIGLDIGYQKDVFAFKQDEQNMGASFDSFNLGLMPRIDLAFLSIGIGGGIKFPLAGLYYTKIGGSSIAGATMFDTKGIYQNFDNPFIPYVKLTLDFILPLNLTAGIYISYDIPLMEAKGNDLKFSSVDLGAQLGIRF